MYISTYTKFLNKRYIGELRREFRDVDNNKIREIKIYLSAILDDLERNSN